MFALRMALVAAFIFGISCITPMAGQSYLTEKTAGGKAAKQYGEALSAYRNQKLPEAIELLDKLLKSKTDFIDAWLLRAGAYFDQRNYPAAEADYEKAIAIDPAYHPGGLFDLARTEQLQMKYAEAVTHFEQYLAMGKGSAKQMAEANRELANSRFSAEAVRNPADYVPIRLSDSINTPAPEYLPSLTADGDNMIYTTNLDGQEDFYLSRRMDGVWRKGIPMTAINTRRNEGAQCIAVDGKTIVFAADYGKDGQGGFDLYIAEVHGGKWNRPLNLGAPINSSAWDSQPTLSADGQTLIFASERPGGLGGRDLWMCKRQSGGAWSVPVNLGAPINTSGDEQSPFLHADGQTLYFMSDGHPGMGGDDLFLSRLDATGQWQSPQNLGYPINTPEDEGAMVVSTDGKTGYFTRKVDTPALGRYPNLDIFSFALPVTVQPNLVTYVKARVFDNDTRNALQAHVEIADAATSKVWSVINTDTDGAFLICLPAGKNYALTVTKEGYLFHSEYFALTEPASLEKPYLLQIGLTLIPEGTTAANTLPNNRPIILRNVFFETGSAALRPESMTELQRLQQILQQHPALRIRIQGHTDNVGEESDNLRLSENRAKAVYDYLVKNGINADRLSYMGFGESQPIDTNDTPQGRQNNRRTEFVIIR